MRCLAALALLILPGALRAPAEELEGRLECILTELDSLGLEKHEAALRKLDAWCDDAGEQAAPLLRKAAERTIGAGGAICLWEVAYVERKAKVMKALDGMGLGAVPQSRELVEFQRLPPPAGGDTDPWEPDVIRGWLVDETATDVTLVDFSGGKRTWALAVGGGQARVAAPGWYVELDARSLCREWGEERRIERVLRRPEALVENLALGRAAIAIGEGHSGVELLEKTLAAYGDSRGEARKGVMAWKRRQLVVAAWLGASWADLAKGWRTVDGGEEMAAACEKLTARGAAPADPAEAAIAVLPESRLLGVMAFDTDRLVTLGWSALPAIIAHLDDGTPTRGAAFDDKGDAAGYWPVCVGDVCAAAFDRLVRQRVAEERFPIRDGKGKAARAAGDAWRAARRGGTEADWWRERLGGDPAWSAARLLALEGDGAPGEILRYAGTHPESAGPLLDAIAQAIGKDDRGLVTPFLEAEDFAVVRSAAAILGERCSDDTGWRAVAKRFPEWKEPQEVVAAMRDLAMFLPAEGADAVAARFGSRDRLAVEVLDALRGFRDPRVADMLDRAMDETAEAPFNGRGHVFVAEIAASALADLLGRESGTDAAARAALRKWYRAHRKGIDWEKLRR